MDHQPSENSTHSVKRRSRITGLLLFAVLCVILVAFNSGGVRPVAVLPEILSASESDWADERNCAECHSEEAESFSLTGHARTLQRANSPDSLAFLKQLGKVAAQKDPTLSVRIDEGGAVASSKSGNTVSQLRLDWCFGSADHARTWVGVLTDSWGQNEMVEFRWSWYHDLKDFATTPGQPESGGTGYHAALGVLYDAPKTRRCFSCHSTILPQPEGRADLRHIQPGVTCQRCHGPGKNHGASDGEVQEDFWSTATQMESINRCGECHRVATDRDPAEISTDNPDLARFPPVGLVQSACFLGSEEMTCMTCHDPHRPLSAQDSNGIWQCTQCHNEGSTKHQLCSAGPRDDCLRCHMPKVKVFGRLNFTDHWIRVRLGTDPLTP